MMNRTNKDDLKQHIDEQATNTVPHVVIVGAGFGGLRVARALRRVLVRVTVIDRNNYHLFQPLLYQVATAALSPADISAPIRHVLRKQKNTTVLMAEVTGIDHQRQLVLTPDSSIAYDYLVVATGASHSYFGHNEWAPYAPGLKSIVDATSLRRKILLAFEAAEMETDPEKLRSLLTFVLIGGGPTGVEMAGAIAELAHKALATDFRHIDPTSARIILVEALPRILPAFPETLSERAKRALNHLGVEVRTNSPVEKVDEDGVVIAGKYLATRNVIWTAGVAASPAGKWLDAEVDRAGRVKVLADLSLPDHPNVFVIGDTASVMQEGKPLPGVAPVAMQEANYVAALIERKVAEQKLTDKTDSQPFHYRNKGNLATIGRSYGIADFGWLRFGGFLGWILWIVVHIFFLIGFRNRVIVLFQWALAYLTFQRGARLITFDTSTSLKDKELLKELV
jgi:NADH:ubiquinone reductase (H+-translocating)